jgi:hypothetical protein
MAETSPRLSAGDCPDVDLCKGRPPNRQINIALIEVK